MRKPLLVAIVGPTASGKTDLSIRLSERFPLTVVSCDSRQVFRQLDIGTAKPTREQLATVPHRCIDIVDPSEEYSAGRYAEDAMRDVEDILQGGDLPLVVGGSGLYIRALLEGLIDVPEKDDEIRRVLQERFDEEGEEQLRKELAAVDPDAAMNIERGKPRRLIRALEVFHLTGRSISSHRKESMTERPFRPIVFGLSVPRAELYETINQRSLEMVSLGLLDETRKVIESGVPRSAQALNTVGYAEAIRFLDGEISEAEMVGSIQQSTRRFAKRQMTWFRGEKTVVWLDVPASRSRDDVVDEIAARIEAERKK